MLPRSLTITFILIFSFTAAFSQPWPEKTTDELNKSYQEIAEMKASREQWEASVQARNDLFGEILQAFRELNEAAKAEASRIMADNLSILGKEVLQPLYKKRDNDITARYNLARLYLLEPKFASYAGLGREYSYPSAMKDMYDLALSGYGPAQYIMATIFRRNRDTLSSDIFMTAAAQELQPDAIGYFLTNPLSSRNKSLIDSMFSSPSNSAIRNKTEKELKARLIAQTHETGDYLAMAQLLRRNSVMFFGLFWREYEKDKELALKGKFALDPLIFAALSITYSDSVRMTHKRFLDLKRVIEEKEKQNQPAWAERKLLADIQIGFQLFEKKEFRYEGLWWIPDSAGAFSNYKQAGEHGITDAVYKLGFCYKHGIGTPKDTAQAFLIFKKLAEAGFSKAYGQLAECYEKGIGTEKNREQAIHYYSKTLESGDYAKAMKAFSRLRFDGLNKMPVFIINVKPAEILEVIDHEEAPVRILHFWHEGVSPEEYRKTAILARHFADISDRKVRLFFAGTSWTQPELAEGMSNRGVTYLMDDSKRSRENKPLYEAYEKKLIGEDNLFREKLLARIGNIYPDFDSRWSQEGLPATFVYIKGEQQPYYFSASAPVEKIVAFVRERMK